MNFDPTWFGEQAVTAERAWQELELKTQAHQELWNIAQADWNVDIPAGEITFTNDEVQASATVQIVGTYNTEDGTWLWGWDHPSVPPHCAEAATAVLNFAQQHQLIGLQERKIECSEADAWAFTALAAHLTDAQGAYRGPAGSALVFMTFGNVSLSRRGNEA